MKRRLIFLALPPFLKSASDVIGAKTIATLKDCGVESKLEYLWSDKWAQILLSRNSKGGHLIYKYLVSPFGMLRHLNSFGSNDIVWMYDISLYANLKSTILENKLSRRGTGYVFQLHDDWLSVKGYKEAALDRISLASVVGGVTQGILDSIARHCPTREKYLLRAPIDTERLQSVNSANIFETPRVIWTGNPKNIKEIPGAMDILANVYAKKPFDFTIISGSQKPSINLPIPWSWHPYDAEKEAERISGAVAGLAPLEDTQYARCKDVFKVKTYMACGVPPIATAIGNNLEVIRDGETGFLVRTQEEWEARLTELIANPEKSRAMGQAAREDCVKRFSHATIIPEWIEVLEERFGRIIGS